MNQERNRADKGLERIVAALKSPPPRDLPEDFADRVVATALRQTGRNPGWIGTLRGMLNFLVRPRQVVLRPVWQFAWGILLCAVSAGVTVWGIRGLSPSAGAEQAVLVRFALKAPGAHQVALVGDFNSWGVHETRLQDPEEGEVWHIVLPLKPGVYQYMFVVDGKTWMPDPLGNETVDDGFGHRNSLMKVVNFIPENRGDQLVL